MSNSITLAETYLPLLDEVYKAESKTAILDTTDARVRFAGGNKVEIFKTAIQGLGDYARASGFVSGDVTGTWEAMTLSQDRARKFMIDSMDNEETLGMAFGTLVGEFLRTQVIPELDAYRFSKLASYAGLSATAADITVGTTDVPGLIDTAEQQMGDAEVPLEGRILFVSELAYNGLKSKITRYLANENGVNREIEVYNNMRVVRVPKGRFNTAITLYDGSTSGEESGGFVPTASTGYPINFMIVHPSAIVQTVKHEVPRIFSPDVNQTADAWMFQYRIYHDIFKFANKANGIYLFRASTANS